MSDGLYALTIALRPVGAVAPASGRMAHGAFLRWIQERDEGLATALHEGQQARPFTVGLLPGDDARRLTLRCTLLDDDLFAAFCQPAMSGDEAPVVRLGAVTYQALDAAIAPTPGGWAGRTTWAEVATKRPATEFAVTFATPTCFSGGAVGGRQVIELFPQPERLWESWARRWSTFAPPSLSLDAAMIARNAATWLLVAEYDLHTVTLDLGRAVQKGFVGSARYVCRPNAPPDLARQFALLAAFAFYGGTGYKTTMGMGVTRTTTR